jgi:hypothetical protein
LCEQPVIFETIDQFYLTKEEIHDNIENASKNLIAVTAWIFGEKEFQDLYNQGKQIGV